MESSVICRLSLVTHIALFSLLMPVLCLAIPNPWNLVGTSGLPGDLAQVADEEGRWLPLNLHSP